MEDIEETQSDPAADFEARLGEARAEAVRLGVGGYERHIFICTGPDCCTPEQGLAAWSQLKAGVAQLNKTGERGQVYRSKVGCLRICHQGPTAVVYPEGTWYGGMEKEALARVIREDLGKGCPVAEFVIGSNPLALAEGE